MSDSNGLPVHSRVEVGGRGEQKPSSAGDCNVEQRCLPLFYTFVLQPVDSAPPTPPTQPPPAVSLHISSSPTVDTIPSNDSKLPVCYKNVTECLFLWPMLMDVVKSFLRSFLLILSHFPASISPFASLYLSLSLSLYVSEGHLPVQMRLCAIMEEVWSAETRRNGPACR